MKPLGCNHVSGKAINADAAGSVRGTPTFMETSLRWPLDRGNWPIYPAGRPAAGRFKSGRWPHYIYRWLFEQV